MLPLHHTDMNWARVPKGVYPQLIHWLEGNVFLRELLIGVSHYSWPTTHTTLLIGLRGRIRTFDPLTPNQVGTARLPYTQF